MMGSSGESLTPGIHTMDYTKARLQMDVRSAIEAEYRLKACAKEPWTVAFIEAQPKGSWFIDIGANTGPYTLVAVVNGLRVLAVEPSFSSYAALKRNLVLNRMLDKAICFCASAIDRTGLEWFSYSDIRPGGNGHRIGERGSGAFTTHTEPGLAMRLDEMCALAGIDEQTPVSMKIDVDGYELAVLSGAPKLLASPALQGIMVEITRKTAEPILALLSDAGWTVAEQWTERDDPKMQMRDIYYARFARAGV